jgi:glycosyltransferase involved in cell wall biosynthesis
MSPEEQSPSPDGNPAYSVVIPFYNEEANVARLLAEVRDTCDKLGQKYEVIAVNDGSRDRTAEILAEEAAKWPQCRVLPFARNRGQAAALLAGMRAADGRILITMDGDGQNDPADIPALLEALPGVDMVTGIRANRRDSKLRKAMSRIANRVRSRFLGDGISDSGCALRVFRREVVSAFLPIRTLYSFMPALAVSAGFRVIERNVNHRERGGGKSNYGLGVMLWRPLVDMLGVRWFASRRIQGYAL